MIFPSLWDEWMCFQLGWSSKNHPWMDHPTEVKPPGRSAEVTLNEAWEMELSNRFVRRRKCMEFSLQFYWGSFLISKKVTLSYPNLSIYLSIYLSVCLSILVETIVKEAWKASLGFEDRVSLGLGIGWWRSLLNDQLASMAHTYHFFQPVQIAQGIDACSKFSIRVVSAVFAGMVSISTVGLSRDPLMKLIVKPPDSKPHQPKPPTQHLKM